MAKKYDLFPFPRPLDYIVSNGICAGRGTGTVKANRNAGCESVISEVFLTGSEPTRYCSRNLHRLLHLPYPFQRYGLNDQGELMIPGDELENLLRTELEVYLIDGGRRIEAHTTSGTYTLSLQILPANGAPPLPEFIADKYDISRWVGRDGRDARVIWLD